MQACGTYSRLTVHVPYGQTAQFRKAMRSMGFQIEKRNAIDIALDDIEAGRVHDVSSVDELRKKFA